jgi:Ca-activated chloride channel family protein
MGLSLLAPQSKAQDNPQEITIERGLTARRMNDDSNRIAFHNQRGHSAVGAAAVGRLSVPGDRSGLNKVLGLKALEVNAEIEGMTARTTITHVFENDTDSVLEGVFTFPLPEDAAVDRFAMTIHGETDLMEGSLVSNEQAHGIYNNIVYGSQINRDPGVLELMGANTFRATIFPIEARRTKTIVVSYLQPLQLSVQEGYEQLTYRFPLSNAKDLPRASRMKVSATLHGLHRDAEVGASLNPTLTRDAKGNVILTSAANGDAALDQDWIVTIDPPARTLNSSGLIVQAHRPDSKENGTFAMTVAPSLAAETTQSLDAIFMINTSARRTSAEYEKMISFIKGTLSAMSSRDRFAIVPFDIFARPMPDGLLAVNDENIKKACDYLGRIQPMGACDIAGAFDKVRSTFENNLQRHVSLIYIGDTKSTYDRLDPALVQPAIDATLKAMNAEMFPVLSCATNTAATMAERSRMIEQLQDFCGGNVIDLGAAPNPAQAGTELASKLGMPMLRYAKLQVHSEDGSEPSLLSPPGGGLYINQGTPFFGTYSTPGSTKVVLTGRYKNEPFRQEWTIDLPEKEEANAAIEKLWAKSRIAFTQAHIDDIKVEAPRPIALKYHVLSKETAFLVLESEDMYREFSVKHSNAVPNEQELHAKFLAGSSDSGISMAPAQEAENADTQISVRLIRDLKLCSPLLTTTQVGGIDVELSLNSARVKQYQTSRHWPLLRLEQIQVRLGISRLLAAERGLPFEPETVYPEMWLKSLQQTPAEMLTTFSPDADETIWKTVESQPAKVEGVKPSWASALNDVKIFDEAEALVNPEKMSSITFSADGSRMQIDSHLLAHHIFTCLIGQPKAVTFDSRPWMNEIRRVVITRSNVVYSLSDIPADKLSAAFNFLAQVALVEGQSKLAGQLAQRAIDTLKPESAKHTFRSACLTQGIAAELRCDYVVAAANFQKMVEKSLTPLVKSGKQLTYESLINTMSLAGNFDGTIAVMERWRAEEGQRTPLTIELGKAYLNGGRTEDAIRAASSDCDFDVNIGKHYPKPEGFLELLIGK